MSSRSAGSRFLRSASTLRSEIASVRSGGCRRCRATEQYEYPVGARSSPLDLSTSFGLGRDIQGRRDQVYTLSNTDRSAVCPKQGTGASMLIQQKPHGHGNRFGLVSGSQLLGRLFDQGDDVGSIDSDNVHHVAPLFCRIITSLMICWENSRTSGLPLIRRV